MLTDDLEVLFRPFRIGSIQIKNRYIMCAMGMGNLYATDGSYSKDYAEFLIERAKGGVGLIITRYVGVKPVSLPYELCEREDLFLPLKRLTKEIHRHGTKIFMQLSAGAGRSLKCSKEFSRQNEQIMPERVFVGPTDGMENFWQPEIRHRALTVEEIHSIVDSYSKMARIAQNVGFDGVEVHAVHEGYLLDQFAIGSMNLRTDEYGGTLENRMRFVCEIIRSIKNECGKDFPVAVRYSVASKMKAFHDGALPGEAYVEFGRSLEESPAAAKLLEECGCDLLDADNGSYDAWYWAHPPIYMPMGCNLPEVSYIKNFVSIPVACAGRMDDPYMAADAIRAGKIDAVGMARSFLADPNYVNKVKYNEQENIRPCIACHNGCLARPLPKRGCILNPLVLKERLFRPREAEKAEKRKNIAVVGGGIGGMQVAILLARRGHEVVIFEKTGRLGGIFNAATSFEFSSSKRRLIKWYEKQVRDLSIDTRFHVVVDAATLSGMDFHEIIIATGAKPKKHSILKGSPYVLEATKYLLGTQDVGKRVILVGGGVIGCEIAYNLAKRHRDVTIIDCAPDGILDDDGICMANRSMLIALLKKYKVKVYGAMEVVEILNDQKRMVICSVGVEGKRNLSLRFDSIISAIGYESNKELYVKLKDKYDNLHVTGDARQVGNLESAINDAYRIAWSI